MTTPVYSKSKNHGGITALIIILVVLAGTGLIFILGPDKSEKKVQPSETTVTVISLDGGVKTLNIPEETQSEYITVPNFIGLSKNVVMADAEARRILEISYEDVWSRDVPVGTVARQSLANGGNAAVHSQIVLYVSKGPEPYVIENLAGTDVNAAKEYLESKGLTVMVSVIENDGTHIENTVAAVNPGVGQTVYDGGSVTVSAYGLKPVLTTVPSTTDAPAEPSSAANTPEIPHGQDKGIFEIVMDYIFAG